MGYFDQKFFKREKKSRRNYPIDDDLFKRLKICSKLYEASLNDFVNAALEQIIQTENISLYEKTADSHFTTHSFLIRQSNTAGLDRLKEQYGISIYRLVNIAIKNVLG